MNGSWHEYLSTSELGAPRLDGAEVHKFTVLNTRRAAVLLAALFAAMGGTWFAGVVSGISDVAAMPLLLLVFIIGMMVFAIGDHSCLETERVVLTDVMLDSRLYGKVEFIDMIQYRVNNIDAGSYGKSKGLKIWTRRGAIHYNQWVYSTEEYEQFAAAFVERIETYNHGNSSEHEVLENDPLSTPGAKPVAIGLIVACLPLMVLAPERAVLFLPVLGAIGGAILMKRKKRSPTAQARSLKKAGVEDN